MHTQSRRGRQADGRPNPIDIHVGSRVKLRREVLGLSQEKLALLLGLTFQQVQKYESGKNRIGASRLWDIGKVLDTAISFFYEDIDKSVASQSPRNLVMPNQAIDSKNFKIDPETDPMYKTESLELINAYYKINNRKIAKCLFNLVMSLAKGIEPPESKGSL